MPYAIRKARGGGVDLIKRATGKKVSHHTSLAKAEAAIRAIYANSNEVKPTDIRRKP